MYGVRWREWSQPAKKISSPCRDMTLLSKGFQSFLKAKKFFQSLSKPFKGFFFRVNGQYKHTQQRQEEVSHKRELL
jgi:hypothetical protein